MQAKGIVILSLSMMFSGCAYLEYVENLDDREIGFFPDKYVSKVKNNSIYHYGYNQGCDAALAKLGVEPRAYVHDDTLTKTLTRFNKGWQAGFDACHEAEMEQFIK